MGYNYSKDLDDIESISEKSTTLKNPITEQTLLRELTEEVSSILGIELKQVPPKENGVLSVSQQNCKTCQENVSVVDRVESIEVEISKMKTNIDCQNKNLEEYHKKSDRASIQLSELTTRFDQLEADKENYSEI